MQEKQEKSKKKKVKKFKYWMQTSLVVVFGFVVAVFADISRGGGVSKRRACSEALLCKCPNRGSEN